MRCEVNELDRHIVLGPLQLIALEGARALFVVCRFAAATSLSSAVGTSSVEWVAARGAARTEALAEDRLVARARARKSLRTGPTTSECPAGWSASSTITRRSAAARPCDGRLIGGVRGLRSVIVRLGTALDAAARERRGGRARYAPSRRHSVVGPPPSSSSPSPPSRGDNKKGASWKPARSQDASIK